MRRKLAVGVMAALISILYAPLGWCPPPPGFGFIPYGQTYDLGAVPIGSSSSVAITFVVAPEYASLAPYAIAQFGANLVFGTLFYTIDPNGTTCVPGALVTTTSGCTVVVRFSPLARGQRNENVSVAAAPVSNPQAVASVAFDMLTATGAAAPPVPVPVASNSVLVWLSLLVAVLAAMALRRYRR